MPNMISGRERWPQGSYDLITDETGAVAGYQPRPSSVPDLLARAAARHPEKAALVDPGRTVSFRALRDEVEAAAQRLWTDHGVQPGDRVAILLPGSVAFGVAFLAVLRLGAVAVPLNSKLAASELTGILTDSAASLVLVEPGFAAPAGESWPRLVTLDAAADACADHSGSTPPTTLPPPPTEERLAVLIYTSGTTGRPKGAMISHKNLVHSVMSYAHTLGLTEADSTAIAVPMFYITGLAAQFLLFLYVGGTSVILPRFDAQGLLSLVERHQVTVLHAVATVYLKLLEAENRAQVDLSSVRLALCGGGPVAPAIVARLKEWLPGMDFRPVYGLTETSSPATLMPADATSRPDKARSCGVPIPVCDVAVLDDEGLEIGPDLPGELAVRGPMVVKGYWRDAGATAKAFRDGWFRTGDIARYDTDGFVYILDRKKDMINRGGEKVASQEVEAALAECPGVREVAVVGVPHPVYGETVKAFVVPEPGLIPDPSAILGFARSRLAKFKVPSEIAFLDELPKSPYGKILKTALRDR